ncbi:MAG: fumarylacetoacetate hydrolase family protein [Ignavibacteriaceae bacterium]|nr:fumarylacetoacetate hydrolase family protein [Ignavibacteriaceae bacterium]
MKFVSFDFEEKVIAGILVQDKVLPIGSNSELIGYILPHQIEDLLEDWEHTIKISNLIIENYNNSKEVISYKLSDLVLRAPVPKPTSCRDGYAFRQHVMTARRNRGVEMIPEFDQYPVFYFTNHNSIIGPGDVIVEEDHLNQLDFELEIAIVIGKEGRNIQSSGADEYIAGFLIMNDLSARLLQMEEMKLNLGPAKGKDFATSIGPFLVTPDELLSKKISTQFGNSYDLQMRAYHNGKLISEGNANQMNWTFAEIIERASYGVTLYPGDVIGSGTVGTGCYLELNGTRALEAKAKGENFTPIWLQEGDLIELEIELLGKLSNRIVKNQNSFSILKKKKNL